MAVNLPQGDADEPLRRKAGRKRIDLKEKKKKGREGDLGVGGRERKKRGEKCKSPMYFIWSSIIHLEMHLG